MVSLNTEIYKGTTFSDCPYLGPLWGIWEQGDLAQNRLGAGSIAPKQAGSREHWTWSREYWNQKVGASRISKVGAGRFGSEVDGSREIQTPPKRASLLV